MTMMRSTLLFVLGCLLFICQAEVPVTTLEGVLKFTDMSIFNLSARISLNHDEYTTFSRQDGSFILYNVQPGIHQLDVHHSRFHFSQVKIQVLEESMDAPKCLEYAYPGATKSPISHPMVLTAHAAYEFFEPRAGFSILVLFKNPMFLMMAFSVGMMFLLPKMMEGMEPEEKARMKQQMEMQKDPTKMLSQLWGDMTGAGPGEQQPVKGKKKIKS